MINFGSPLFSLFATVFGLGGICAASAMQPDDAIHLEHATQVAQEMCERNARLVESGSPEALDAVVKKLVSAEFLNALRTDEDDEPSYGLNLDRLLDCIALQNTKASQEALMTLTRCKLYSGVDRITNDRRDSLIYAFRYIRHPTADALNYLDSVAQPSESLNFALAVLADIHTREALAIVEHRLLSKDLRITLRRGVCEEDLLKYRAVREVVEMYDRVIHATTEDSLRDACIDGLFDYHDEWAATDGGLPTQQPLVQATDETLKTLARIADEAGHEDF